MKLNRFLRCCLASGLSVGLSLAVTPTIGVASASGNLVIDSAIVEGNGNLFEGSQVKTTDASSQILLHMGAALTLGTNSAGTIYRDHLVLDQGVAKVGNMIGYSVRAAGYRIEGGQPASQAVVRVNAGTVEVAALNGSLKVFNEKSVLITRLGAGTASAFQSGATAGQSGATAGQSGATAGQTGANAGGSQTKKEVVRYTTLGGMFAGLGFGVDAILQPTSP